MCSLTNHMADHYAKFGRRHRRIPAVIVLSKKTIYVKEIFEVTHVMSKSFVHAAAHVGKSTKNHIEKILKPNAFVARHPNDVSYANVQVPGVKCAPALYSTREKYVKKVSLMLQTKSLSFKRS